MAFLQRVVEFFTSTELLLGVLWAGLAALSVTLLILMRTRWGQSQPLRKCLMLSLLAHVLLACYATTVTIVACGPSGSGEPTIHVLIADEAAPEPRLRHAKLEAAQPWETLAENAIVPPAPTEPDRAETQPLPEPDRTAPRVQPDIPNPPDVSHVNVKPAERPPSEALPADAPKISARTNKKTPEQLDAPEAQRREAPVVPVPVESIARPADKPAIESPERPSTPGLPASLLKEPAPLPRIAQTATSETAPALASLADQLPRASHGSPAELPPAEVQQADSPDTSGSVARRQPPSLAPIAGKTSDARQTDVEAALPRPEPGAPQITRASTNQTNRQVPAIYHLRTAPDRSRLAHARGATEQSEAAVRAALKWLAENQDADGRWNPRRHEGGRELQVAGRDRQGAGIRADTGMTGLALLTFLAAGHTHEQGDYPPTVRNGLTFLVSTQKSNGSLAGDADTYAAMYCHAMATIALSEAYAMSGDSRLKGVVQRAVDYTVASQDPNGGGWRYVPNDPGDTSQFGWQLMAIKSADLAGIHAPEETWRRMFVYLKSVSSGRYGGLAAYRMDQEATRPMTAEALVCRQFLGMPPGSPTGTEAGDYLLGQLPGDGKANLYYWYYATLGMYQLQGEHWRRWNEALQTTLLALQRTSGSQAGSWDTNTVWGGYGGRVYTTAMATLCLEVYYRYLPLYTETAAARQTVR